MSQPKRQARVAKKDFSIAPARRAAFDILIAVDRENAHSDDLLRTRKVERLSLADRNLATALVLGVLRWQIALDRSIQAHLTRPGAKLDREVLIALRLGAFQILHMDRIPARAAIDESVELTKAVGHRFASSMVNAVLRKLAIAKQNSGTTSEGTQASIDAHPVWIVERWMRFFGAKIAEAICAHGQTQPKLSVRLEDEEAKPVLDAADVATTQGELLSFARIVVSGDVTANAEFQAGRVRIQDEGSQLVAELAAVSTPSHVQRILDACAAPGGKTMILAELLPKAKIVVCEISAPRHEKLRERLARFGDRIECRLADATQQVERDCYDLVLVDAPCSGTGTLNRNPEIRHRLQPDELLRQAERQRAILSAALSAVRVGGRVLYSTCSLEPEENEQVVEDVLAKSSNVRQLSLSVPIEMLCAQGRLVSGAQQRLHAALDEEGSLRLMPGVFGTDGFFIALLERTS